MLQRRHLVAIATLLLLLSACGKEEEKELGTKTNSTGPKGSSSQGADPLLEYSGSPQYVSGGGYRVAVYPRAIARVDDGYQMQITGAGLRQKTVLVATVDVFVAAHYISGTGISQNSPLQSIAQSNSEALVMSLVRDVSASQISDAFREALSANGVNANSSGMRQLFSAISGDVPAGTQIEFVSIRATDGIEHVFVNYLGNEIHAKENSLGLNFWKMFFGTPVDDGGAQLKQSLIGL